MKLFYTKRSPYARKVRIMAIEKQIPLEFIEEDLTKKSEWLLNVNPLAKVPALVLDNGEVVYDSPVICQYLDHYESEPRLIPASGADRLKVLQWEALGDGMTDVCLALYMEKIRHPNDLNQPFIAAQEETLKRALEYLNEHTEELKKISLASISIISALGYIEFRAGYLAEREKYQKLFAWADEFSKRPSVASTVPVQ